MRELLERFEMFRANPPAQNSAEMVSAVAAIVAIYEDLEGTEITLSDDYATRNFEVRALTCASFLKRNLSAENLDRISRSTFLYEA